MPMNQNIWCLNNQEPLQRCRLQNEQELEDLLAAHIDILDPNWLYLGRQVMTVSGKFIDLLCMDYSGDLIVVELKRDMTPREVTAQAIDYASCMAELEVDEIAEIYSSYSGDTRSLGEAYKEKYHVDLDEENLNTNVKMVIVASQMDASTERIVKYLREKFEVPINILFFEVFMRGDERFLSRAWFEEETPEQIPDSRIVNPWNQEYYVSFGQGHRQWKDAQKYGFISAGGGTWHTNSLRMLRPGDRIWVNIPQTGYVGVGHVTHEVQQAKDVVFCIEGVEKGFQEMELAGNYLYAEDDPAIAEYVVKVKWDKIVDEVNAVWEIGFCGNQNTVFRPKAQKWEYTVNELKNRWRIE